MPDRLRALFEVPERLIGFRGTALLLFALTYVGIGLSIPHSTTSLALYHTQLPEWFRMTLWLGCAGLAILAVFVSKPRWQGRGFFALLLPSGERFTSYMGGVLFDPDQHLRWVGGAFVYFLLTCILLLISAWPEPVGTGHAYKRVPEAP
jgi:hypothetical protein